MIDETVIPDDPGGDEAVDPEEKWELPVADSDVEDVKSGDDESAYTQEPTPEDDPGAAHEPAEDPT